MSKQPSYKQLRDEVPPPYDNNEAGNGYGQPMTSYPNAPQNVYNPNLCTTNVVQVQPGGPTQQGPTTIVVTSPDPLPSMAGHITLSCFVFWCCSPLFGCIAFFVAISGLSATTSKEARCLGKASLWVNISGIIVSVIVCGILLALYFTGALNASETFGEQLNDQLNHNFDQLNNDANNVINDGIDAWNKNVNGDFSG